MKKLNIENDLNSRKEIARKNKRIVVNHQIPRKDGESEIVQEHPVDESMHGPEARKTKTGRKAQGDI